MANSVRSMTALLVLALISACSTGTPDLADETPNAVNPDSGTAIPAPGPTDDPFSVALPETATPTTGRPTEIPGSLPNETSPAPTGSTPVTVSLIDHGESGRREIALTFDAGSDTGHTAEILDILAEAGVSASFGITGGWARDNPELMQRIVAGGHMLINHSWSHRSFTGQSTSQDEAVLTTVERQQELLDTSQEFVEVAGVDPEPWFRPPFGDIDQTVIADLAGTGYTSVVMWSCDTLGWNGATARQIMAKCADEVEAGAIILMHVGEASADVKALPEMIEQFKAEGFDLVTVEELLEP